jgi:hypothetical protein
LGLYVRNVVGLLLVRERPGLIPGAEVEPHLLTNSARDTVWIDRRRGCETDHNEEVRTRQEARPSKIPAEGSHRQNADRLVAVTRRGIG